MYKIKVKRLEKADFSSIVTWLDDGYYETGSEDCRLVTLACIIYDDSLKKKLAFSDGGTEKVIKDLITEFRVDYTDVIGNLINITTLDNVNEMMQIIETFIRVNVVKNELLLLKNQN